MASSPTPSSPSPLDLSSAESVGDQTVPDVLLGCWRRSWIRYGDDGTEDTGPFVVWLQTASGMGDLRLSPGQPAEQSDSSCGITVVDEATRPYMTASWQDGASGFTQQPVSNFPEDGWLDWPDDVVMMEYAPSGAYVERWERLPDSTSALAHFVASTAPTLTNVYVAGRHYFLAKRRRADQRVDEYSYGRRRPGEDHVIVEHSTIASRVGRPIALDHDWTLLSSRKNLL